MLSGFVESASVDDFHFSQEMQSHNAVSSSKNPTSSGSLVKSAAQVNLNFYAQNFCD